MAAKVSEDTDFSGKVTTAVFNEKSESTGSEYTNFACQVPEEWTVVGGGAIAAESPHGALLTASYCRVDRQAWLASSKDHHLADPHQLDVFAIAMKIQGLSPVNLRGHLGYFPLDSSKANHPTASRAVPPEYTLIGGGFRVNWPPGAGNLATASFPERGEWRSASRDHNIPSPCTITTFAIGIHTELPRVGRVEVAEASAVSAVANHPKISTSLPLGFALTGIGAETHTDGPGQLLWELVPHYRSGTASSKDHVLPSPGTVKAFALGIKIV